MRHRSAPQPRQVCYSRVRPRWRSAPPLSGRGRHPVSLLPLHWSSESLCPASSGRSAAPLTPGTCTSHVPSRELAFARGSRWGGAGRAIIVREEERIRPSQHERHRLPTLPRGPPHPRGPLTSETAAQAAGAVSGVAGPRHRARGSSRGLTGGAAPRWRRRAHEICGPRRAATFTLGVRCLCLGKRR